MVDVRLKPKTRNQYKIGEYPYNLLSTIVNESVWETNLPDEFTDDHLDGLEYAITQLNIREQEIIKQRYMEKKRPSILLILKSVMAKYTHLLATTVREKQRRLKLVSELFPLIPERYTLTEYQ